MSRVSTKISILSLLMLLLLAPASSTAQVAGTSQPSFSALELAFQQPAPWDGNKYTNKHSFIESIYISTRFGTEAIWGVADTSNEKARGVKSSIMLGYKLAPIHTIELGVNYGVIPYTKWQESRFGVLYNTSDYLRSIGVEARYLFNFSTYALKSQESRKFDFQGILGLGMRVQNGSFSAGIVAGVRAQYNITSSLGIYVEPTLGYYDNGFDGEPYNPLKGQVVSGVMGGITLAINPVEGYRKVGKGENEVKGGSKPGDESNPMFGITTNALYWAMATPNIGIDVPIGYKFSAGFEYISPCFRNRDAGYYYMAQIFDVDARYWFNHDSKLQGFSAGVHAGVGYYDIQLDDDGVQGRLLTTYGICGGFTQPFGRQVSLELLLGVGTISTRYEVYTPDGDCLVYERGGVFSMLGVTKASISIVWTPVIKRKR